LQKVRDEHSYLAARRDKLARLEDRVAPRREDVNSSEVEPERP
jgi:hypothetical protein